MDELSACSTVLEIPGSSAFTSIDNAPAAYPTLTLIFALYSARLRANRTNENY